MVIGAAGVAAGAEEQLRPAAPTRRRVAVLLALVTGAAFVLRVRLAGPVSGPAVYHDELGYTAVARWLAGQQQAALHGPFYHPAYGALLAPMARLFPDPQDFFRAAQVLNAAVLAAMVPLLHVVARRVMGFTGGRAVVAAALASTTSASLAFAPLVLAEGLFLLLTVALVVVAERYVASRGGTGPTVLLAGVVALGYATHPRAVAWVVVVLLLAVVAGLRSWVRWARAAALVGLTIGGYAAVGLANDAVLRALYPLGPTGNPSPVAVVSRILRDPMAAVTAAAGTGWYLAASSLGLAAVGFVATCARSLDRRAATERRLTAAFIAVNVLAAAALSVVLVSPGLVGGSPSRLDRLAYGRYVEQWLPLLVLAAIGALWRRQARLVPSVLIVAGVGAAATAAVAVHVDPAVWDRPVAVTNMTGVHLVRTVSGSFDLSAAIPLVTAGAVATTIAAVALRRAWPVIPGAAAAVAIATTTSITGGWMDATSTTVRLRHRLVDRIDTSLGREVAFDVDRGDWYFGLYNLQFWGPDLRFSLYRGDEAAPPPSATYVVTTLDDPRPPAAGARLVGIEYLHDESALWAVAPDAIARLDARDELFPVGFQDDRRLPDAARRFRLDLLGRTGDRVAPGATLRVRATHTGEGSPWPTAWPANPVRVGGQILDTATGEVVAQVRGEIHPILAPGEHEVVEVTMPEAAALPPGRDHVVVLGVLQEAVGWFEPAPGHEPPVLRLDAG